MSACIHTLAADMCYVVHSWINDYIVKKVILLFFFTLHKWIVIISNINNNNIKELGLSLLNVLIYNSLLAPCKIWLVHDGI